MSMVTARSLKQPRAGGSRAQQRESALCHLRAHQNHTGLSALAGSPLGHKPSRWRLMSEGSHQPVRGRVPAAVKEAAMSP